MIGTSDGERHVESKLYEDVSSAGRYSFSASGSRESFERFSESRVCPGDFVGRAEILRGRPRHKVYVNA